MGEWEIFEVSLFSWQRDANSSILQRLLRRPSLLPQPSFFQWIIYWYQKFTFHSIFSLQKLFYCKSHHLLIRCYKTRFFLWNTNNTDRNGINKQNTTHTYTHTHTHTPNTHRKITLERVSMKISVTPVLLNNPTYFTNPWIFFEKKSGPPLLLYNFETSILPSHSTPLLTKERESNLCLTFFKLRK